LAGLGNQYVFGASATFPQGRPRGFEKLLEELGGMRGAFVSGAYQNEQFQVVDGRRVEHLDHWPTWVGFYVELRVAPSLAYEISHRAPATAG